MLHLMSGGSPEQALPSAASAQLSKFYDDATRAKFPVRLARDAMRLPTHTQAP